MKDQVTSIEQSRRLLELGVPAEKASMCWVKDPNSDEYNLCVHDEWCYEVASLEPISAFTVPNMLGMMPGLIDEGHVLFIERRPIGCSGSKWCIGYKGRVTLWVDSKRATLSDVCVLGIEWLLSNGYGLEL